jgi:hypothetical protein
VAAGDSLGDIQFSGDDGTNFVPAARIFAAVDGTPGTNDMPGRLVFSTTADGASSPTERMRIDSSGNVQIRGNSTQAATLQMYEDTDNGTNYVALKAPASGASNVTWTLPHADGTADQVLKTDGSGALGWATAGGASNLGDGSATTPSVNFSSDTNTGIYRPGDDRLGFATNGALVGEFDGSNLKFNSGYGSVATAYGCRAWVNFNGTGTPAIREDGNVSSITDNGTGNYTVNFSTAMPDANYSVVTSTEDISGGSNSQFLSLTTTSVTIYTVKLNPLGLNDIPTVSVSVFR